MAITRREVLLSAGALAGTYVFSPNPDSAVAFAQSADAWQEITSVVNLFDFEPLARARISPM
ncbi:MAG: hypothetical protein ACRD9Y_26530, partial [Blastocatellia bacterium]